MSKTRKIPLTKVQSASPLVAGLSFDVVRVADLTGKAYLHLRRLNLKENGLMQGDFTAVRKLSKRDPDFANKAIAVIAQHPKHGIIGWSLLFNDLELRVRRSRNNPRTKRVWKGSGPNWTSHFYVMKKFRGLGLGTELYNRMTIVRKGFHKFSHSVASTAFFKKNK